MNQQAQALQQFGSISLPEPVNSGTAGSEQPGLILDARVERAIDFILANLQAPLTVPSLVDAAGLSASRFCRLFRSETGISPARFVKVTRMRRAAALLAQTSLSVKEVAAEAGFEDCSHFVRDFQAMYGNSPGGYRAGFRSRHREVGATESANKTAHSANTILLRKYRDSVHTPA